ncbi:MAG: 1-deoxy-D-xylulose-5-phosphate reductoisomerase [Chloroflexota bacterium]
MKNLVILGSTGSIGRQTLDVVRAFPDRFNVLGLAAGNNQRLLTRQIVEFKPRLVSSLSRIELPQGTRMVPLEEMAADTRADLVMVATAGKAGLAPTLAALRAGKTVALANKEALVMAGELVMAEAKQHRASIRPVDSEHSAVWQCLTGEKNKAKRLTLTASGGPFYRYPTSRLATVTPQQALKHPTWKMGRKVTIDSATLMNKGLEVIEAHWLFEIPVESIGVVIHPQSIIHALIEFADGSVKAQMAVPDMRLPIQYALTYPKRLTNTALPGLDLTRTGSLTFETPDLDRFPCLKLALGAARAGGTHPTVLCAADEVAVDWFLKGRIGFTDIPAIVYNVLEQHEGIANPDLDEIMATDEWARQVAAQTAKEACR